MSPVALWRPGLGGEREFRVQNGSSCPGAIDEHETAKRLHAVFEAREAGAAADDGVTDAIVADSDRQNLFRDLSPNTYRRCPRVLGRVGQRLGDHVIRGDLDVLGQPLVRARVNPDRIGGTAGERPDRGPEAASCQYRWVDAARDFAHLVERAARPGDRAAQLGAKVVESGRHFRLGLAELQRERDQSLLRAVVQISLDMSACVIRGGDDPGP